MGAAKADLEWHGSTLLYRAAAVLARTVDGPVIVVAAPGQELPELPAGVAVVEDPVEGLGPMQGLADGTGGGRGPGRGRVRVLDRPAVPAPRATCGGCCAR